MSAASGNFNLSDLLAVARRRRKGFAATFAGGLVLCLLLTILLPAWYLSSATILIEQQEIPQEMVRSTITSYADQRLQLINQRVMSSQNLLEMAEQFDLYPGRRASLAREELVEEIRDNIEFDIVSAQVMDPRRGIPTQAAIAFSVGFSDREADKAYRVANELTSLYLEENLKTRTELARETSSFLDTESRRLEDEVQALEKSLSLFKEDHVLELPELLELNWSMYERYQNEIRETNRAIASIDDRVVYLTSELALINPYEGVFSETGARLMSPSERLVSLKAQLAQINGRYSENHPDVRRLRTEIASLESEVDTVEQSRELRAMLEDRKSQLASISDRYSTNHPDVLLLKAQVDALIEMLGEHASGDYMDPTNPAYIQIAASMEAAKLERSSLVERVDDLELKLKEAEGRIARAPEVEREYRELGRHYQNTATKFAEVKAKQMEAQLAESLEADRKGEKFTLIDPPQVPERPEWPNRMLVFFLGAVVSLLAAVGVCAVRESMDPRIYSAQTVSDLFGLTPLGLVPVIESSATSAPIWRSRAFVVASAAALMAGAVFLVLALLLPVDAMFFALLRTLGLGG